MRPQRAKYVYPLSKRFSQRHNKKVNRASEIYLSIGFRASVNLISCVIGISDSGACVVSRL